MQKKQPLFAYIVIKSCISVHKIVFLSDGLRDCGGMKGPHDHGPLSRAALLQLWWARKITEQEQCQHEQGQQKTDWWSHQPKTSWQKVIAPKGRFILLWTDKIALLQFAVCSLLFYFVIVLFIIIIICCCCCRCYCYYYYKCIMINIRIYEVTNTYKMSNLIFTKQS